MTVRDLSVPAKVPAPPPRGACPSYTRNSKPGLRDGTTNNSRWAWQDIPVLQLPPVKTAPNLPPRPYGARPRGLVAKMESRILRVKEEEGVESVLRRAEQILRERHKSALGRWANHDRDFVGENRRETAGSPCCRRREQEHANKKAIALRNQRRKAAVRLRNERQRLLITSRGMANSEVRRRKVIRDRAFAELVYRRIYTRTGGNARAWAVIVASITRLKFMHAAVGMEARRLQEALTAKSMDVVGRFLCQAIIKRRRIRAVQIIAGALGAFTNSNVIRRYAGRIRWGARRLQAAARQRVACMTDHLDLLSRHWDHLYPPSHPPALKQQTRTKKVPPSRAPPATASAAAASTKPAASSESGGTRSGNKRSPRKKGGGGGGGKTKTKGDSKRQGGGVSQGGISQGGISQGGVSPASTARAKEEDGGGNELVSTMGCTASGNSEPGGAGLVDGFGEAKREEIMTWLRQAQSKHSQERIIYERFTVFPSMVELLLQHEGEKYHNRLQAIERATFLRSHGQLLRAWVDQGYHAKMAHVIPPPPRLPRLFSREEGDAMFERATVKSKSKLAAIPGPV